MSQPEFNRSARMPGRDNPNAKRELDGRYRNTHKPLKPSPKHVRALWVQEHVVKLQNWGMSFEEIASALTAAGRGNAGKLRLPNGEEVSEMSLPEGADFPTDYRINKVSCYRAWKRAISGRVKLEVHEMQAVSNDRLEKAYLSLQPSLLRGDVKAVRAAVTVIHEHARINGYGGPSKIEVTGMGRSPAEDDEEFELMASRLDDSNQLALLALMNKARGGPPRTESDGSDRTDPK